MKKISRKSKFYAFFVFYLFFGLLIPSALSLVFPGTYSFEGEVGRTGTEISFIDGDDSGSSCVAEVVAREGDHDDVLKLGDSSGSDVVEVWNNFGQLVMNGYIEFYIRSSDVSKALSIQIASGEDDSWYDGILMSMQSSKLYLYISGASNVEVSVSSNVWYKIKVQWDCGTGKWSVYVDDDIKADDIGFSYSTEADSFGGIKLYTASGHTNYEYYLDGIKYSWDVIPGWLIPSIIVGAAITAVIVVIVKLRGREGGKKPKAPSERRPKTPKKFKTQERIIDGRVVPAGARIVDGKVISEAETPAKPGFCPNCGTANAEGVKFCISCGRDLNL